MSRGMLACLVLVCCFMTGCPATLGTVLQAKVEGEGTTQTYAVSPDQAWQIARTVFRWEGSDAIEEHRDQGYMLTSSGIGPLTPGTLMGAWITPTRDGHQQVTVITKRRSPMALATTLTETTFQTRFAQAVALLQAGRSLPLTAP